MKEYKFLTLHSNGNTSNQFSHAEKLLNEWTSKGWEVDKMVSQGKDQLVVLLVKSTDSTMILD